MRVSQDRDHSVCRRLCRRAPVCECVYVVCVCGVCVVCACGVCVHTSPQVAITRYVADFAAVRLTTD